MTQGDGSGATSSASGFRVLWGRLVHDPLHGPLPGLLLLLTVLSGLVDAVSLLRLDHVFVANMTGNVVFVGLGLAGVRGFSFGVSLSALGAFTVGAAATARFPVAWRRDRARFVRASSVAELVLAGSVVVAAAVVGISADPTVVYLFTAGLGMSMGIQNAVVQRLGVPDLPTTVLTTTLTRLMIDLPTPEWRSGANAARAASVACLLAGASIGAVIVVEVGAVWALGFGIALLAAVGLVAHCAVVTAASWRAWPHGGTGADAGEPLDGTAPSQA